MGIISTVEPEGSTLLNTMLASGHNPKPVPSTPITTNYSVKTQLTHSPVLSKPVSIYDDNHFIYFPSSQPMPHINVILFTYLITDGLFNNAVSASDYIALNGSVISKQ
jgi:hypothetical protein